MVKWHQSEWIHVYFLSGDKEREKERERERERESL